MRLSTRSPSSASPTSRCRRRPNACGAPFTATATPLAPAQPGEAVGAPVFAANPVMHEEEAVGVVFLLDGQQSRIVRAPIGGLPVGLEEVAFGKIRARPRCHAFQLVHRFADRASISAIHLEVRPMTRNPGKSGSQRLRAGAAMILGVS